jgi:hypothetical protein
LHKFLDQLTASGHSRVRIYRGKGGWEFGSQPEVESVVDPDRLAAVDLDRDGAPDPTSDDALAPREYDCPR